MGGGRGYFIFFLKIQHTFIDPAAPVFVRFSNNVQLLECKEEGKQMLRKETGLEMIKELCVRKSIGYATITEPSDDS